MPILYACAMSSIDTQQLRPRDFKFFVSAMASMRRREFQNDRVSVVEAAAVNVYAQSDRNGQWAKWQNETESQKKKASGF